MIDRAANDDTAVGDQRARDVRPIHDLRGGALFGARMDDPVRVVEVQLGQIVQEGEIRLPVRLQRADILPVALEGVGEDVAALDQVAG